MPRIDGVRPADGEPGDEGHGIPVLVIEVVCVLGQLLQVVSTQSSSCDRLGLHLRHPSLGLVGLVAHPEIVRYT
jgi:hypothetical protein